jgi:hypothetical protein
MDFDNLKRLVARGCLALSQKIPKNCLFKMIFVFSPFHYSTVCEPSASVAICGFADQILFCDLRI